MGRTRTLSPEAEDEWFRFLGYGNPRARIWFVGIEPGGESAKGPPDPRLTAWQSLGESWTFDEHPGDTHDSSSWTMIGHVVTEAGLASTQDQWNTVMLANMAPLPRQGTSADHGGSDEATYRNRVKSERISFYQKLLDSPDGPRVMIFFGKSAGWVRYGVEKQFQLHQDDGDLRAQTESRIRYFELQSGKHLVLMNHPAFGNLRIDDMKALGRQVAQWLG